MFFHTLCIQAMKAHTSICTDMTMGKSSKFRKSRTLVNQFSKLPLCLPNIKKISLNGHGQLSLEKLKINEIIICYNNLLNSFRKNPDTFTHACLSLHCSLMQSNGILRNQPI